MLRRAILAIVLISACRHSGRDAAAFHPLDVGEAVPAYAAPTLAGDTVRIGGPEQATVLNVWATWCTSCQEEMAALDSLTAAYAPHGVRVVAVSVDNGDIARVRRFAETNKLGMTVAHDPADRIGESYAVMGVPTTFIIDKDGKLLWRHTGNISPVLNEAREVIAKATTQPAATLRRPGHTDRD